MAAKKGKSTNLTAMQRTKHRIRRSITGSESKPRLSVFKSCMHTYAQLISDKDGKTLASASTLDKEVKEMIAQVAAEQAKAEGGNAIASTKGRNAATAVGLVLAKRGLEKNVKEVVFDRNRYKYVGRIKAVADGARKGGFDF